MELNVAPPMFISIEMKELFRDDKIYGIVESDSEMSKVISMFEDSEDIYEGKERVVGTLQVAAGQHGDHFIRVTVCKLIIVIFYINL